MWPARLSTATVTWLGPRSKHSILFGNGFHRQAEAMGFQVFCEPSLFAKTEEK